MRSGGPENPPLMRLSIRAVATSIALLLIVSGAALANTGNDFASCTCGQTSNVPRFSGSHGFLLDHNIFTKHGKDWDGDTFTGSVGFEGRYAGG
jgi:hypothetical protein